MHHAIDVLSLSPLRAASLLWQPRRDTFVLTLVVKATFALVPVKAELASEQEHPNEEDNHWNDDVARSVYSPSDLAPRKPRAEVMVVGHAFAPRGERAKSVVARVVVGEVDKSIAVFGDRSFGPDGVLREGPPFTRVPIRYERAAGGFDTSNPVGVRPDTKDAQGGFALPSVQPPSLSVTSPKDFIPPIGFGPLAPSWPTRRERLGPYAGRWSDRLLAVEPMPDQVDPHYFMAAPPDQHLNELHSDERIVLEHLHAEHPRLVTNLPGIEPRAFAEIAGKAPHEIPLTPDTLWIDTDRSIATLTWRGQLPIDPSRQGRILVALGRRGWPVTWAEVEAAARRVATIDGGYPKAPQARPSAPAMTSQELGADDDPVTPPPITTGQAGPPGSASPSSPSAGPGGAGNGRRGESAKSQTLVFFAQQGQQAPAPERSDGVGDASPAWLRAGSIAEGPPKGPPTPPERVARMPQAPPLTMGGMSSMTPMPLGAAASPPPQTMPPPPLSVPAIRFGPPPTETVLDPSSVQVSPGQAWRAMPAPPVVPPPPPMPSLVTPIASPLSMPNLATSQPSLTASAPSVTVGQQAAKVPGEPAKAVNPGGHGVIAASNAAAGREFAPAEAPSAPRSNGERVPMPTGDRARPSRPRDLVELLWFEPSLAAKLRTDAGFRGLLSSQAGNDSWITTEQPERDPQAERELRDRRDVQRALSRAELFDVARMDRAIEDAFDEDGAFTAPLALMTGDLTFRFDEREALKATVTTVTPMLGADKKLRDVVTEATEALKAEWPVPTDVAEGLMRRIETAFNQAPRATPPGYLQGSVDKLLLEGRHYRTKSIFSEPRIRAELSAVGTERSDPIPSYLPVALAMRLPLFSRFRALMLAELRTQEDQHESHPYALLIVAIARVIERRRL